MERNCYSKWTQQLADWGIYGLPSSIDSCQRARGLLFEDDGGEQEAGLDIESYLVYEKLSHVSGDGCS